MFSRNSPSGVDCPALIEKDDAVMAGIEKLPLLRCRAGARSAVQENDRNTLGVSRLFVVKGVDAVYLQAARIKWV